MINFEILGNERRKQIYSFIQANPGVHLREIQRFLDVPISNVEYNLSYMAKNKVITEDKGAHYSRYYSNSVEFCDKRVITVLRQKRSREIVLTLLLNKRVSYRFLADYLKWPIATISLYLKQLLDGEIIDRVKVGENNVYVIKDEERIVKILSVYKSSFLDKILERAVTTWVEAYLGREKTEE